MPAVPARPSTVADDRAVAPAGDGAGVAADGEVGAWPAEGAGRPASGDRGHRLLVLGLVALLAVPLVVALVVLRRPQWFPILDLAMTELRVRDVGTADTPLIGLPGRIGVLGPEQGSHPGPLSFWLLAPVYRLSGATAWSLQVASIALHVVAMAVALWLAGRRGGRTLVLATAALLAVLTSAYGAHTFAEAWNPYLPLLWWVVVLLAIWSVLDEDPVGLPVMVFAGSLCAQTHAPYALLVGGMGVLALAGTARTLARSGDAPATRRRVVRWLAAATVLGAVLWLPPLVDQVARDPGNISLLVDHFGSPPEEPVGLRPGVEMTLLHLDPIRLATGGGTDTESLAGASTAPEGSSVPGAVMLAVWAAAVVVAARLRHRALLRLHLVVGVALALAVVSISRIFGQLWYYLMTWAWGITAVLVLAVVSTFVAAVADRRPALARSGGARRAGVVALAVLAVASTAGFAVDAADVAVPAEPLSDTMRELLPQALDGLDPQERYLVTWSDSLYIGAQGVALVNELDRLGFDVGVVPGWSVPAGKHRLRRPDDATALVHLANGPHVERWRAKPGVSEIAFVEPRRGDEVATYDRLRDEVLDELTAAGFSAARRRDVSENLFSIAVDPGVPERTQEKLTRMHDMGLPTAVFLAPVAALD